MSCEEDNLCKAPSLLLVNLDTGLMQILLELHSKETLVINRIWHNFTRESALYNAV